jgi:hypothetical protein
VKTTEDRGSPVVIYLALPFIEVTSLARSRGSSGSIVSDYGLDDRVIEVRSPTGAENFYSSPCVQAGSETHPAPSLLSNGCRVPGALSPGVKRVRGVTLTTHPHLVAEVKYEKELYLLSPHAPPWRVAGHLYFFFTSLAYHHEGLAVLTHLWSGSQ